ncbi:energy-coupling factor transport system substrate-specific component [Methanococcus maripaludis]|uniref:Energy-coupling factor transport system substrate-specific component n=1 Tax=Methanococcus maripaludis TaxID=39152 RepID=A0A7J9NUY8_METMI|nr:ECF transporter S component [Methanococcus maripaludis]MBA2851492.1 energy-coupling factor transport system substrate-specific component [Methanococcus maripaludis]
MKRLNHSRCRINDCAYVVAISLGLNILGSQAVTYLQLPAFLDSTGTILAAVLLGPLFGSLVGLLTNLIEGFFIYSGLYYFAIVNILIGFVTGVIFKKYPFNVKYVVITTIILALIGTIVGNIIAYYLFGGITGSPIDDITIYLVSSGMSVYNAVFVSGFIINLFDKIISFVLVFVIIGFFQKYVDKCYLNIKFDDKTN